MVSVGNVEEWDLCKLRLDRSLAGLILNGPCTVANAVRRSEVYYRRGTGLSVDQGIDDATRAISQEDRAGLGIQRLHVPNAIIFLIRPSQFVLLDHVLLVILATRRIRKMIAF